MKIIKHDFFKKLARNANLEKDNNENFKCQFFYGKHFIMTPFKRTENRFSISCLICATKLTQYTKNGKVH